MPGLPNSESVSSLRPASISQPFIAPSLDLTNVPSELHLVLGLLSLQHQRRYCDGYIQRKHVNLSDGKSAPNQEWCEFYAQLNGTVLSLWDAAEVDKAAFQGSNNIMPQFIDVTDAVLSLPLPQEHTGHTNVLAFTTAGANRYFFEFQNMNVLMRWSTAFRIAMYERAMLQECYTAALIARARSASAVRHIFAAYHGALGSKGKYSGWVKVKFGGNLNWQRCWTVVSDTPSSWSAAGSGNIHERLWYKFSNKQSLRGEARFYESRRDPKNKPLAVLTGVYSAYAVYPEKPSLVDSSTLIKIEGSITTRGATKRMESQSKDAFLLLMPDDLPTSSSFSNNNSPNTPITSSDYGVAGNMTPLSPNRSRHRLSSSSSFFGAFGASSKSSTTTPAFENMLTWLVALYDAFALYGRPERLITDPTRRESMIFAMPSSLEDSYLDVEIVYTALADTNDLLNNNISSKEWRIKMKEMTFMRVQEGKKVFNSAILLASARPKEIPVIKEPKPPIYRPNPITSADPSRTSISSVRTMDSSSASVPTARVSFEMETHHNHALNGISPRIQKRLGGILRKKSKNSLDNSRNSLDNSSHSRNFSESEVAEFRQTNERFSLRDDSEDENDAEMTYRGHLRSSSSSPHLRNGGPQTTAESESEGRATRLSRASSHRRVNSDTRIDLFFREAHENIKRDDSDRDSLKINDSNDDMIPPQPITQRSPSPVSPVDSIATGTHYDREFDPSSYHPKQIVDNTFKSPKGSSKLSEFSSIPGGSFKIPSDTPPLMPSGTVSSPSSSMESLPVLKARDLPYDYYNDVPQNMSEAKFNQFKSQPALLPYNGQPVPVRRVPSPIPNVIGNRVVAWQPGLGISPTPQKIQPQRGPDATYLQQRREPSGRAPSPRGARPMPVQYNGPTVGTSPSQSMEIRGFMADPNPNGHLSTQERESMARMKGQSFLDVVGPQNGVRKQRSFDERPIYQAGLVAVAGQQQQERRDMLRDVNLMHHKVPQRRLVPGHSEGRGFESIPSRNETGMAATAARVALGDIQTSQGPSEMWKNSSYQGLMPPAPINQPMGQRSMSMASAPNEQINWDLERKAGYI